MVCLFSFNSSSVQRVLLAQATKRLLGIMFALIVRKTVGQLLAVGASLYDMTSTSCRMLEPELAGQY